MFNTSIPKEIDTTDIDNYIASLFFKTQCSLTGVQRFFETKLYERRRKFVLYAIDGGKTETCPKWNINVVGQVGTFSTASRTKYWSVVMFNNLFIICPSWSSWAPDSFAFLSPAEAI